MTENTSTLIPKLPSNGDTSERTNGTLKPQGPLGSIHPILKMEMDALVHAYDCSDSSCALITCKRNKSLIKHSLVCRRQTNGGCQFCHNLFKLCCYHAKYCQKSQCSVANCEKIKLKMQQRRKLTDNMRTIFTTLEEKEKDKSISTQIQRRLLIEQNISTLAHAMKCHDARCSTPSCAKKKGFLSHWKSCKQKAQGGCTICKQIVELICYHSKSCLTDKCPLPLCENTKRKIQQIPARKSTSDSHASNGDSAAEETPFGITKADRQNSTNMLSMAMCPPDSLLAESQSIPIDRAQRVERRIFERANNYSEYIQMIVDEIKSPTLSADHRS